MSVLQSLKNLSVKNIIDAIVGMVRRFPLVVLATILGTSMGVYAIELGAVQNDAIHTAQKVLLMSVLAVPIFLSLTLWRERFEPKEFIQQSLQLGSIVFLVGYYFLLPGGPEDFSVPQIITLILLNIIFWLLVLAVPFLKRENTTAEWRYIETLVIWFFVTGIFSATLFAGLALSLWAVDYLFSVKWDEETYAQLWSIIVGIFASWFFLCRFPKQPQDLDKNFSFPAILRIFVQFILVPLLCIFYVILYTYTGKILVTWNWPLGGVAVWILAFSITGVLTYLIGQPLIKHNEYPWLKKFFSIFFALILPLTVVLFMAIGIRINEYGLTEQRYLVVLFGLWLIAVALYYLSSKKKEIKFVPLLTAAVFLLSLVGPWSMFNLSVWSQYNRLETLLVQNELLVNGKVQKVAEGKKVDSKLVQTVRSQIQFLADHNEIEKIQPWFTEDLEGEKNPRKDEKGYRVNSYTVESNAFKQLGLDTAPQYNDSSFSYRAESPTVLPIGQYQYFINDRYSYFNDRIESGNKTELDIGGRKIRIRLTDGKLQFLEDGKILLEADMDAYAKTLLTKYNSTYNTALKAEDLALEVQSEKAQAKIYISSITGTKDENFKVNNLNASVLFSFK